MIKNLLPEHIQLVAEKWNLPNWFTEYTPLEKKIDYLNQLILCFDGIGVFPLDDPLRPIAWNFRKPGQWLILEVGVPLLQG